MGVNVKRLDSLDGSCFGNVLQAVLQAITALQNTEYDTGTVELVCNYESNEYVIKTAKTQLKLSMS